MVAVPPLIPVTRPVVPTLATAILLLLHTPPDAASVRAIEEPEHTVDKPVITPAFADRLIVTVAVA